MRIERFDTVKSGYFVHHVLMIDLLIVAIVLTSVVVVRYFFVFYRRSFAARRGRFDLTGASGNQIVSRADTAGSVIASNPRLHEIGPSGERRARVDRLLRRLLIGGGVLAVLFLGGVTATKLKWLSFTDYVWVDLRPLEDMVKVKRLEGHMAHLEDGRRVLLEWYAVIPLDEMLKQADGFVYLEKWGGQYGMWVRRTDEDIQSLPRAALTIPIFRRELNLYGLTVGGKVFEVEDGPSDETPDQILLP